MKHGLLNGLLFSAVLWGLLIFLVFHINAAIRRDGNPFQLVAARVAQAVSEGK